MTTTERLPASQRLLVNARAVAELLSISRSKVFELRKAKLIPAPIELEGCVGWRREELQAWCHAGCPAPSDFTYRPGVVGRLEDLIRARHEELAELQREIAELEVRRERGDNSVTIRAR